MSFHLVCGEDVTWRLTVLDADGVAFDFTDCRVVCTIKRRITDAGYEVRKDSDAGAGEIALATGQVDVKLLKADTVGLTAARHIVDVLLVDAGDNWHFLVAPADLTVVRGVTEAL